MGSEEIRKRFLGFFAERGHVTVPSSSLIPDDPSVLLTTAGMQQFKAYYTGEADPMTTIHPASVELGVISGKPLGSKNAASIQKSFRTSDIDEVGDESHLTFFEMLGNFSFGGYFKERAIVLSFEFITSQDGLGIDPHRLYVTAFKGDEEVPRDDEAIRLWQERFRTVGIDAKIGERIFLYGRGKNWWEAGPGPAGPDAEMFYDFGTPHDTKFGPTCHPNCDCGRFVEIGNDVFVQYNKTPEGKYEPLEQKAIDNGRGFERLVMVMQGKKSVFDTDLFTPLIALLPEGLAVRIKRIIADHIRGIAFLLADGLRPSNKEAGYVLRRLMRRVMVYETLHSLPAHLTDSLLHEVIHYYGDPYQELLEQGEAIRREFGRERERFSTTMARGMRELEKLPAIDASSAFRLYESYGLPFEILKELGGSRAEGLSREAFDAEFARHQEISRAGGERKFGGHGLMLDTGELRAADEAELKKVTRLHTATHLLNSALHKVLGDAVDQRGSDITVERTRFDFLFPRKLTIGEVQEIENLVNYAIERDFPVTYEEMDTETAKRSGALYFYKGHYPPRVKVYSIGDERELFSRELCGGPHVNRTNEIGRFKIAKEESSSAGVRRIRATVEP